MITYKEFLALKVGDKIKLTEQCGFVSPGIYRITRKSEVEVYEFTEGRHLIRVNIGWTGDISICLRDCELVYEKAYLGGE